MTRTLAGLAADVELVQSLASTDLCPERLANAPYARPRSNSDAEDLATTARHLLELNYTAPVHESDVAAFIRTVSTRRADIVEFGLNVPTEMEGTSLPIPFQKAVLRLVREEKISRERALGLLQSTFEDDDLPPRRTRREDELWKFVS